MKAAENDAGLDTEFTRAAILGLFRLRVTRPDAERPYRAFGYPYVPAAYIVAATVLLVMLFIYRNATTWPGFVIVALGVPVYFMWGRRETGRE
jgi:APA family basic amino acid/polyamine antiporter